MYVAFAIVGTVESVADNAAFALIPSVLPTGWCRAIVRCLVSIL